MPANAPDRTTARSDGVPHDRQSLSRRMRSNSEEFDPAPLSASRSKGVGCPPAGVSTTRTMGRSCNSGQVTRGIWPPLNVLDPARLEATAAPRIGFDSPQAMARRVQIVADDDDLSVGDADDLSG